MMNYKAIIDEALSNAEVLLTEIQQEAKARYADDDICRLCYEVGYLQGIVKSLMVDLALEKNEVPALPTEPENT